MCQSPAAPAGGRAPPPARRGGGGRGGRELSDQEVAGLEAGARACVETLLDGETFLALRVFLSADCGPAAGG
jgi:hypothetical protein